MVFYALFAVHDLARTAFVRLNRYAFADNALKVLQNVPDGSHLLLVKICSTQLGVHHGVKCAFRVSRTLGLHRCAARTTFLSLIVLRQTNIVLVERYLRLLQICHQVFHLADRDLSILNWADHLN